ncbi:MAG: chemotaxis-specific protein-glutamate methyltransferase CheB [Thermoanaerobaculia bacterium]|jgi:two-component system chemotaxis response regulator CheB
MSESLSLRVLVVDDSAVVRQTMLAILEAEGIAVTTAADPIIAAEKMRQARPDVILLDLEMPRMDGLTFLEKVMADDPVPVIVCSAVAGRGTEMAMRALELGAVDIVEKPRVAVREFLQESVIRLTDSIRGAAVARRRPHAAASAAAVPRPRPARAAARTASELVIAIGASTGGPEALHLLLEQLDADAPGVVVVQHMPRLFTREFAKSLDRHCAVSVGEAASGDRVERGRVLIAPGDMHMTVERSLDGAGFQVSVSGGPLVSRHRPSVDVMFRSVAAAAGARAVGVLLTGMGSDGADGLLAMKGRGALTIAQDEESSVVYGMPREAVRRGAATKVLPLSRIAGALPPV